MAGRGLCIPWVRAAVWGEVEASLRFLMKTRSDGIRDRLSSRLLGHAIIKLHNKNMWWAVSHSHLPTGKQSIGPALLVFTFLSISRELSFTPEISLAHLGVEWAGSGGTLTAA